jgi:hypothetical protein
VKPHQSIHRSNHQHYTGGGQGRSPSQNALHQSSPLHSSGHPHTDGEIGPTVVVTATVDTTLEAVTATVVPPMVVDCAGGDGDGGTSLAPSVGCIGCTGCSVDDNSALTPNVGCPGSGGDGDGDTALTPIEDCAGSAGDGGSRVSAIVDCDGDDRGFNVAATVDCAGNVSEGKVTTRPSGELLGEASTEDDTEAVDPAPEEGDAEIKVEA